MFHSVKQQQIYFGLSYYRCDVRIRYPGLHALLDPPTVMMDIQGVAIPAGVVIDVPPGFPPPLPVPAFPGSVGMWACHSQHVAGDLIGHLRAHLAPLIIVAGRGPRFVYVDSMLVIR